MCDHVCVCVICGRIGLCGTVLLRHDVEVSDRQSLFSFSFSFSSLSLSSYNRHDLVPVFGLYSQNNLIFHCIPDL